VIQRIKERRRAGVAVPAANVRVSHLDLVLGADGVHLDAAHQPKPTAPYSRFQHHVGATVGPQDSGHGAAGAQFGLPRLGARVSPDEAALLGGAATVKILIVVWALVTGWRLHFPNVLYERHLHPRDVLAAAGIHADRVTFIDKEGNLHLQPGL